MNKEKRELLLNELMQKEIEKIRKIVRPYSRNKEIFYDDVIIKEKDLKELNASGLYKFENDINYIYVNTEDINYYIKYENNHDCLGRYYRRNLKDIIGHELTHAFVRQKFKYLNRKIEGIERDASPIFLAHLRLFGYTSGHNCSSNFYEYNMNNKVIEIKSENTTSKRYKLFYKEIREYLNNILDFKEEFNNKQKDNVINEQTRDFIQIDFCFSARGSGLKKYISSSINTLCKDKGIVKGKSTSVTFAIGSSIQNLEDIKRLVYKKINNGIDAKYYHNSLIKCTNVNKETKILKQIEDKNY
ncbi:hypothetical protein JW813_07580 [Clostridium botulinum]|uniref:hypothetical protein n=1 Tax=Clostridium botulinum TaxID=1491 RepID=UPI002247BFCA|nr:hypothetical protein [Clostridium botulinum]UZP04859.1 hypothetical protein JW813_07580 [Clostridium botulinum]UZP08270.1 hypothetical protein JYA71_07850 [Clostridium botulinum]UZP11598.1 hypothetical protein JYA74_07575 [Clostridium botulinum]